MIATCKELYLLVKSYNYNSGKNATYSYGVNTNTTTVSGYTGGNRNLCKWLYLLLNAKSTNHDNYSTYGNHNPYTGTIGSRARVLLYTVL